MEDPGVLQSMGSTTMQAGCTKRKTILYLKINRLIRSFWMQTREPKFWSDGWVQSAKVFGICLLFSLRFFFWSPFSEQH